MTFLSQRPQSSRGTFFFESTWNDPIRTSRGRAILFLRVERQSLECSGTAPKSEELVVIDLIGKIPVRAVFFQGCVVVKTIDSQIVLHQFFEFCAPRQGNGHAVFLLRMFDGNNFFSILNQRTNHQFSCWTFRSSPRSPLVVTPRTFRFCVQRQCVFFKLDSNFGSPETVFLLLNFLSRSFHFLMFPHHNTFHHPRN